MEILKKTLKSDLTSVLLPLVVLFTILATGSRGFLSAYNAQSILQTVTIYLLAGLAQMVALSLGQFNLAIGSMGCLSAVAMGYSIEVLGFSMAGGIAVCLVVGSLCGAIQGWLIAKSKINPFIVTLSLLSIFQGIGTVISQGSAYNKLPESLTTFNRATVGFVPVSFLVAMVIWLAIFILFRYCNLGHRLQAVGANQRAGQYAGIPVTSMVIAGHVLSGLLCGLAAIIQTARFSSAQISIGEDWMMTSFVVAVLGGTLLSGGKVSTIGALLGAFLMVLLNNAIVLWGVSTYAFQAIMGLVLLIAYEVDRGRVAMISKQSELRMEKKKKKRGATNGKA